MLGEHGLSASTPAPLQEGSSGPGHTEPSLRARVGNHEVPPEASGRCKRVQSADQVEG